MQDLETSSGPTTAVGRATVDLSGQAGGGDAQVDTVTASVTVDGAQAGVAAAVEGRLELQGTRTAIAITGAETHDPFDVTARGGPQADVADIMGVELTLTQSGSSTGRRVTSWRTTSTRATCGCCKR